MGTCDCCGQEVPLRVGAKVRLLRSMPWAAGERGALLIVTYVGDKQYTVTVFDSGEIRSVPKDLVQETHGIVSVDGLQSSGPELNKEGR